MNPRGGEAGQRPLKRNSVFHSTQQNKPHRAVELMGVEGVADPARLQDGSGQGADERGGKRCNGNVGAKGSTQPAELDDAFNGAVEMAE